ncbi:MAG: gas vesicle protein [Chloroflexi bacterium]|nr:gas vesicle protein [Chloroflexota bacterium]
MTGSEIAEQAKKELAELTGLEPGTVSALRKDEEGWHVNVDMVEMKYVPDTGDVLAVYEALLDDQGNLISYQRTRRYHRGQVTGEE